MSLEQERNIAQVIKKGIAKTMLWTGVGLLSLLMVISLLLQSPAVQTYLVAKIGNNLSEKIGFTITLQRVDLKWFDKLQLQGVKVIDQSDSVMIYVAMLEADFNISELINGRNSLIDAARLFGPDVKVYRYVGSNEININQFIKNIKAITRVKDTTQASQASIFKIADVQLKDGRFSFADFRRDSIQAGFDYYHFTLDHIHANLSSFMLMADTLEADIKSLSMVDTKTKLDVKQMQTQFMVSELTMRFNKMLIEVGNSLLRDSLVFNYTGMEDLSEFNDSVTMVANFRDSHIASTDLAHFATDMKQFSDSYEISGKLKGKVTRFSLRDIALAFGERSILRGAVSFDGLPDFSGTFIDANLKTSAIYAPDLQQYISSPLIYENLSKFGDIRMQGQFVGFPNDFVTKANFSTALGNITSDINLKLPDNKSASYSGKLSTENFQLGKWFKLEDVGNVTLTGEIDGQGLSLESADFNLNAKIKSITYKNYNYTNIATDARLAKELFSGDLDINDENLRFQASGTIDLRNRANLIQIKAKLDTASLQELNLSAEPLFVKSTIDLKTKGLQIDSIIGKAIFYNTQVVYKNRSLAVDSMQLISFKEGSIRTLTFGSERVELSAVGNYNYTNLVKDVQQLIQEYKLKFENNSIELTNYYSNKSYKNQDRYSISFNILLKNFSPILEFIAPELSISKNTSIEGIFSSGRTSIFSVSANIDSLYYRNQLFIKNIIDINTSKIADSSNVLAMAYLKSGNQVFDGFADSKNLVIEAIWDNDRIDFQTGIAQANMDNKVQLNGNLRFKTDTTLISFLPSYVQILNEQWTFDPNGTIQLIDSTIYFNKLSLTNKDQQIYLDGAIAKRKQETLTLNIRKTKLESFNSFLARQLFGEVNSSWNLQQFYSDFILQSELSILNFKIEEFPVGNIEGSTRWITDEEKLNVNFNVLRHEKQIVKIQGYVQPKDSLQQLKLIGDFNDANISIAEPFLGFLFSEMSGTASGRVTIGGTFTYPVISGEGIINNGGLKVNYLNTTYRVAGKLVFSENSIAMRNVELKDIYGNTGSLNGGIFHDGFRDFVLDLRGTTNNLMILNTSAKDNSLYYGTAITTGTFEILGSVNNLYITAKVVSDKGTKMFIPVSESSAEAEKEEFINFITKSEQNKEEAITSKTIDLRGLRMDFDLELTPDAYCEIIFDIKTGDIIRGRGNGKLKFQIDTNGEFNMFGNYEITEGGYNFTLYNIINKEFQVQSGSTINWYGDPYTGILDLNANYEQLASIAPLLDTVFSTVREVKRRYPSVVQLHLAGPLLSPEISFAVDVKGYPPSISSVPTPGNTATQTLDLNTFMNAFKARLLSDEQELNRQVFSLIILRRFSPPESFGVGVNIGNSVSEFLSNQINYWVSQISENLEFEVDLSSMDAEMFNTFQLRLAYTFLDGRLRISRDGGFNSALQNESDQVRGIVGDWTLEYLLTPDGKLRAKMYNRTNYNPLAFSTAFDNATATTAGISLMHVESFDHLTEIWRRERKKKQNTSNPPDEEGADDNGAFLRKDEDEELLSKDQQK